MARASTSPTDLDPTTDSLRPSSVWTNDSTFADSAISMGSSTPKQLDDEHRELRFQASPIISISERLSELAAVAWAAEQDSYLDDATRKEAMNAMKVIESCLGEKDEEEIVLRSRAEEQEDAEREQAQLQYVHEQLVDTVASMRLRQQAQRHIQELALRKLDDVGSTCAAQEDTIESLRAEVERLKIDNQKLRRDNDGFQAHAIQLTSELEQKDIAVQAMSSAVAGLDGWVRSALGPERPTRRVRATRGRGRFRTHYYVDVPIEGADQELDRTVDAREVRDGLTAWVRGFRDVEDAVNTTKTTQPVESEQSGVSLSPGTRSGTIAQDEDDWGDFQTASTVRFE
jgi:hypothetical protein